MLNKEIGCYSFTPIKKIHFHYVFKILIIGLYLIVILQVLPFNFQNPYIREYSCEVCVKFCSHSQILGKTISLCFQIIYMGESPTNHIHGEISNKSYTWGNLQQIIIFNQEINPITIEIIQYSGRASEYFKFSMNVGLMYIFFLYCR